jgi:hypothetical protein
MTKTDARYWMHDNRWTLLQKFRQLSELKAHFEIEDSEIFNVLTSHAVLLYLDDNPMPIFEAYEAFESEDIEAIVYGSQAETEAIAIANNADAAASDLSSEMATGEPPEVGYTEIHNGGFES